MKVLVTGTGGFIMSALVSRVLETTDYNVRAFARNSNERRFRQRVLDNPTIKKEINNGRCELIFGDLLGDISGLCEEVDVVIHGAARTFVDHSIKDPWPFIESNIIGTFKIIEDARRYKVKKFVQISTDEVYGPILTGSAHENYPILPSNIYAASKSSGEAILHSYAKTYDFPGVITRFENVFGERQHPQKVFPAFTRRAMNDEPLGIYGDGGHIRCWLYLSDAIDGVLLLLEKELPFGSSYNIAGNRELTNLDLAKKILKILGKPESLLSFIPDADARKGHDRRYSIDSSKIRGLGWTQKRDLEADIEEVVCWYRDNPMWYM